MDLYAGDQPYPGITYVTAVSRDNGQFWTEKATHGTVTFGGLYPGTYDLVVPGAGGYLGGTLPVTGKVKKGKTSFGTLRLSQRGATVAGTVVDANDPSFPLSGAIVTLLRRLRSHARKRHIGRRWQLRARRPAARPARTCRVVAGPGPYSPYLGQGTRYCKYGQASVPVAVTTGQTTALGGVPLPHLPNEQQDGAQCHTPPGP